LPTFGLLGFIGILFFLAGLFGMMLPGIGSISFEIDTGTLNAAGETFFNRLAWLSGTLIVGIGVIALLARYVMPSFAAYRAFVLTGHEQEGYIAGASPHSLPQAGTKGEVVSTLRPAGKVMIDGTIYDAITSGKFIEKGELIQVERLDGSVIVVSSLEKGSP
jgi:membrane-bound ClpP family serine protease